MRQSLFESKNRPRWLRAERALANKSQKIKGDISQDTNPGTLPANSQNLRLQEPLYLQPQEWIDTYKMLCQHLAIARGRAYSPMLIEELENLVRRCHDKIYRIRSKGFMSRLRDFFGYEFPCSVRRHWRPITLAALFFWGSGLIVGLATYYYPDFIYTVMDAYQVSMMESMYSPDNKHLGLAPDNYDDSRTQMFGFYVWNNASIGLRVFATGLLFGLGTIMQLLFNGINIGAVAGYLTQLGYISTFWAFVSGHAAFELGAITLSGGAGLMLGQGVIQATRHKRSDYLRMQAMQAMPIIAGATVMFFLAAIVEAYWSPLPGVQPQVKYAVGIVLVVFTLLYFVFAGRSRTSSFLSKNSLSHAIR